MSSSSWPIAIGARSFKFCIFVRSTDLRFDEEEPMIKWIEEFAPQ